MRPFRKRHAPAFLILVIVTGLILSTTQSFGYDDLKKDHWAYEQIHQMSRQGILSGYPDGTFRPDRQVTYGEFLKILYMAKGEEALDLAPFPEHWSRNYYDKSLSFGWMTRADFRFTALDQPIPRMHMALLIWGVLQQAKGESAQEALEKEGRDERDEKGIGDFIDVNEKTPYCFEIEEVFRYGILSGYPDGSFGPGKTLTRAEAATAAGKLIQELEDISKGQETESGKKEAHADGEEKKEEDAKTKSEKNIDWKDCPLPEKTVRDISGPYPVLSWRLVTEKEYPLQIQKENNITYLLAEGITHGLHFFREGSIREDAGASQLYSPSQNLLMVVLKEDVGQIDYFVIAPQTKEGEALIMENPYRKE